MSISDEAAQLEQLTKALPYPALGYRVGEFEKVQTQLVEAFPLGSQIDSLLESSSLALEEAWRALDRLTEVMLGVAGRHLRG